ncbi:MAG: hypothetical protein R2776_03580 [Flavobacteriaceae bacterium]|nr:hypothetical protein [Flavobacteriaceae bacterium]
MNRKTTTFLLLFIASFYFSCDYNNVKKVKTEEYFKGYSLQPINFLNKKVYVPSNYTKVNLNELGEMLRQNPELNSLDKLYYKMAVEAERETKKVAVLYVDSLDKKNSIWFIPAQYFPLKREYVNDYVHLLETNFFKQQEANGYSFERLESKFLTINGNQSIKVAYKRIFQENILFQTQYIITTTEFDTFSITVTNNNPLDFQKILKSL